MNEEPLTISQGGLSAPLPIPAYRVLSNAKEHPAKDVLICLISHIGLGKKSNRCFPSYTTICRETGRGRKTVSNALNVLIDFGFILKYSIRVGKRKRNVYKILDRCYHTNQMTKKATSYLRVVGRCQCGAAVREGEYGVGANALHHYGCGAVVHLLKPRNGNSYQSEE
jgi:hypothetical protein